MVDLWPDKQILVCLNADGKLDIVKHRLHRKLADHTQNLQKSAFKLDALFEKDNMIAVATYNHGNKTSSMYLLDRRGKVLSKATDQARAESPSGPNPVQRIEFSIVSKSNYILDRISSLWLSFI